MAGKFDVEDLDFGEDTTDVTPGLEELDFGSETSLAETNPFPVEQEGETDILTVLASVPRGIVGGVEQYARAARTLERVGKMNDYSGLGLDDTVNFVSGLTSGLPEGDTFTERALQGGIQSFIQSVMAGLPGAAIGGLKGGVAGSAGSPVGTVVGGTSGAVLGFASSAGVIFGLAEYDKFLEELEVGGKNSGLTDVELQALRSEFQAEAIISAIAEGAFEAASDLVQAKVLGLGGAVSEQGKSFIRSLAGKYFKSVSAEIPSELATSFVQTKARESAGIETPSFSESFLDVVASTAVASVFFTGAGSINLSNQEKKSIALATHIFQNSSEEIDAAVNGQFGRISPEKEDELIFASNFLEKTGLPQAKQIKEALAGYATSQIGEQQKTIDDLKNRINDPSAEVDDNIIQTLQKENLRFAKLAALANNTDASLLSSAIQRLEGKLLFDRDSNAYESSNLPSSIVQQDQQVQQQEIQESGREAVDINEFDFDSFTESQPSEEFVEPDPIIEEQNQAFENDQRPYARDSEGNPITEEEFDLLIAESIAEEQQRDIDRFDRFDRFDESLQESIPEEFDQDPERIPEGLDEELREAFGANNKLFTKQKRDDAINRLKDKGNNLQSGLDPSSVKDIVDVAGFYAEAGVRNLSQIMNNMAKDLGEWVRNHTEVIRNILRDNDFKFNNDLEEASVDKGKVSHKDFDENESIESADPDPSSVDDTTNIDQEESDSLANRIERNNKVNSPGKLAVFLKDNYDTNSSIEQIMETVTRDSRLLTLKEFKEKYDQYAPDANLKRIYAFSKNWRKKDNRVMFLHDKGEIKVVGEESIRGLSGSPNAWSHTSVFDGIAKRNDWSYLWSAGVYDSTHDAKGNIKKIKGINEYTLMRSADSKFSESMKKETSNNPIEVAMNKMWDVGQWILISRSAAGKSEVWVKNLSNSSDRAEASRLTRQIVLKEVGFGEVQNANVLKRSQILYSEGAVGLVSETLGRKTTATVVPETDFGSYKNGEYFYTKDGQGDTKNLNDGATYVTEEWMRAYLSSLGLKSNNQYVKPMIWQKYGGSSKSRSTGNPIRYISGDAEYGMLSNFAHAPFELDGKKWPSVEHYYQAQKFKDDGIREVIRTRTKTALQAKRHAQSVNQKESFDPSFYQKNEAIMKRAMKAKFSQDPSSRRILESTIGSPLIENNKFDSFWGVGKDGKGKNRAGQILEEVRDEIFGASKPTEERTLAFKGALFVAAKGTRQYEMLKSKGVDMLIYEDAQKLNAPDGVFEIDDASIRYKSEEQPVHKNETFSRSIINMMPLHHQLGYEPFFAGTIKRLNKKNASVLKAGQPFKDRLKKLFGNTKSIKDDSFMRVVDKNPSPHPLVVGMGNRNNPLKAAMVTTIKEEAMKMPRDGFHSYFKPGGKYLKPDEIVIPRAAFENLKKKGVKLKDKLIIYRHPVVRADSVMVARIKGVHDEGNVVMMNPVKYAVFSTGDYDGDTGSILKPMQNELDFFDNDEIQNLVGDVDLEQYKKGKKEESVYSDKDIQDMIIRNSAGKALIGSVTNNATIFQILINNNSVITASGRGGRVIKAKSNQYIAPGTIIFSPKTLGEKEAYLEYHKLIAEYHLAATDQAKEDVLFSLAEQRTGKEDPIHSLVSELYTAYQKNERGGFQPVPFDGAAYGSFLRATSDMRKMLAVFTKNEEGQSYSYDQIMEAIENYIGFVDGTAHNGIGNTMFEKFVMELYHANPKLQYMGKNNPESRIMVEAHVEAMDALTKSGYNERDLEVTGVRSGILDGLVRKVTRFFTPGNGMSLEQAKAAGIKTIEQYGLTPEERKLVDKKIFTVDPEYKRIANIKTELVTDEFLESYFSEYNKLYDAKKKEIDSKMDESERINQPIPKPEPMSINRICK